MVRNIVRELEQIASRRKQLVEEGQRLVHELNQVLPELGYRVVPAAEEPGTHEQRQRQRITRMDQGKRLRCPECDRTFGQPMNLGRHMAATHRKGGRKQRSGGRGKKKAA